MDDGSSSPATRIALLEARLAEVQAELEAQRDNGRFLESVLENLPAMIFVKDAEELRFRRFNAAGERLLGFRREDLLGRNDYDFFPKAEADFFVKKDRQVLRHGKLLDIPEEPIHTAAGVRILHTKKIPLCDPDGTPRYLLGISEDITDRKAAEAALTERTGQLTRALHDLTRAERTVRLGEERLRAVLHQFPGVVWTTSADLTVVSTAGAHATRLGLDPTTAVDRPLAEVLPGTAPGVDVLGLHRAALTGEGATWEFHAAGHTYEATVRRLEGGDDLVTIALDVTERRRVEEERLRARLERTQKLELLGLLAGGIAHDFNNLLTVILGNATLALLRLPEGDNARTSIQRVERAANTAADLTRQLLAYSGKGRFVVEATDLSRIVEEIGSLLRVTVPRAISLKLALASELPPCEADPSQIRQIVLNLISNAADAIGEQPGAITLSTGVVFADRDYLRQAWLDEELPEGQYVWLEVSDTGVGMDVETQNHMFDPFFTTKAQGHGLGLSATLGIVRGHRGAIRVYSEPGRGTTIKLLFPVSGSYAAGAGHPTPSGPTTSGCVLVVDDEEAIREFAKDALQNAGLDVLTAGDGVEALEVFQQARARIDAVLLDMTMPRMGGEACFRELRRLRPEIRVLLMSGYNEQDATSRFAGKGLAGFLQKPFTAGVLIERIRALVGR